ncbi:MAG: hypothetical protein ACRDDY_04755 [Clostridium sp.]|uniref:hypothetical protein n=1 Tax=Clostridium sp. TaxID=1506 RepID=UPI003EE437A9
MKITKKAVLEFVRECKRDKFGWTIYSCGFFTRKDGTLQSYIHYTGQGMNSDLYNGNYVNKVDVNDLINDREYNQKDKVESIYDTVNDLINDSKLIMLYGDKNDSDNDNNILESTNVDTDDSVYTTKVNELTEKYMHERYKLNKEEFILLFEKYVGTISNEKQAQIQDDSTFWYAGTNQKNLEYMNNLMCKNIIILGWGKNKDDNKDDTPIDSDSCINEDKNKLSRFLNLHDKVKLEIIVNALDMSFKKVRSYNIDSLSLCYHYMNGIMNHSFSSSLYGRIGDSKFKDIFEICIFNELKEHNLNVDDNDLSVIVINTIYSIVNKLQTKVYFDGGYHVSIEEYKQLLDNPINDSTRDDIISIVTDVLNDDKIEYSIDGEYNNVYDLLNESNILSHKNSVEYSNLLYEFDVKYIKKHPEEFKTYEDIIHTDTWDDKVDRYMNDNVYPILKNLKTDAINDIIN